jgi:hypothetical protein
MDFLANVPSWDDIERNLDDKFNALNQGVSSGLQSANDGWDGMSRRVSNGLSQAYGYMGGDRIDHVRQAMALSYPIMQSDLTRKWASININEIMPVLIKLVQDVVMILGGSVAVGGAVGGAVGSLAFGVGALPGAMVGSGIGLQVGNLILMALGLAAIAEYFYQGLPACLATLQEGLATAWHAEDGLKPAGLDPSGGSAAQVQERTERAARQLARGQEQLVMLLLTAIVTYLTRGQMKAGVMNSLESIATRSARLQSEISNKEFATWLARNEQKILAQPELQAREAVPVVKVEPEQPPRERTPERPTVLAPKVMSLREAVGKDLADSWIKKGREQANLRDPALSALLSDDQIGALFGYSTNDVYKEFNAALRSGTATPEVEAFAHHATEGLARLPQYAGGESRRGTDLPKEVLDRMQMGATETDKGFFSSSAKKPFDGNTQMLVRGVSGKDISFLTKWNEAEILYPPGTSFKVLNRIESGSTTHLLLEEVP